MIRLLTALVLSVVFLVFVLQNLKTVELNFLVWDFNGSLALILILTFVIGILISTLVSIPLYIKKGRSKKAKETEKLSEPTHD